MGERTTYGRSHDGNNSRDPDFDAFGDEQVGSRAQSYRFGRATRGNEYPPEESMPMFLSGYDEEEEQHHNVHMQMHEREEYGYEEHWPARPRRPSLSSRILLAVVAAAAVAVLFALVTSDATRDLVATAKASIIGSAPDPTAPQPSGTQLTARDLQLNEPARLAPAPVLPEVAAKPVQTASAVPSREEIANAYQSALQNRVAVEPVVTTAPESATPSAPAPMATAPASITAPGAATAIVAPTFATPSVNAPPPQQQATRRMDPDELAGIMKRAKSLLASGDIPPARLLLERAADAQEPAAALMLAQTYDAQVLGTRDVRNINADPNAARNWYRRAAQLGSAEAQRRLNQLQN
jgi:hypothetical protein